jgi:hypothetical protein
VEGGVYDNQGTVSLLASNCNVLPVSDAAGQLLLELQPATGLGGLGEYAVRSMDTLMERIRQANYGDLSARLMSGLIRGLMFPPTSYEGCAFYRRTCASLPRLRGHFNLERRTMSNTKNLTESDLRQFTGTETWFRHSLNRKVLYTESVQYVAENGGAYWLLDEIALTQLGDKKAAAEAFQLWKLSVRADRTATLACDDGDGNIVFTKEL